MRLGNLAAARLQCESHQLLAKEESPGSLFGRILEALVLATVGGAEYEGVCLSGEGIP